MKVSLWNIFAELTCTDKRALIKDGYPGIEGVRLLANTSQMEGIAFVGSGSDFFEDDTISVVIAFRHDMILVGDAELYVVFNEVCSIMERYRQWGREMDLCIGEEGSLQGLVDCCRDVIHHPIFIYGRDGLALAIESDVDENIHWLWKEIVDHHGLSEERMQSLKSDIQLTTVFQDSRPTIRESSIDASYQYMHCSLRCGGQVAGHMVLFSFDHPFEPGLEHLVALLVERGSAYMDAHSEQFELVSKQENTVAAMLEGRDYSAAALLEVLGTMGWHIGDLFRVHVLCENVEGEPVLVSRTYAELKLLVAQAIFVRRHRMLLVLENVSCGAPTRGLRAAFENTPSASRNFTCGTSAPFNNLAHANQFCDQALEEMQRALNEDKRSSCADEHSLVHYASVLENDSLKSAYILPSLVVLENHDRLKGTAYVKTLCAYCLCGFHGARASQLLGIHRNSLVYRIERIRQLIDFAPFDALMNSPNLEGMTEVFLSFYLMEQCERE